MRGASPAGAGRRRAASPRARRTQAERTASTRKRLVAAVHACISERGLAGATASEIAERAGMTWGAVQHHFGGKDGILAAVLEDSVAQLGARLVDLDAREPLARRVASFVERAWEHFASPQHRSTFEILLHFGSRSAAASPPWQGELLVAFDGVWTRVFPDVALPRRRRAALEHYTVAALSGLAALRLLEPTQPARDAELALLRDTLLREMCAA